MKMKLPGLVLAIACGGAGAAKADWEYTKWGMTPQQVVSASKNLTKESAMPLSYPMQQSLMDIQYQFAVCCT